MPTIKADWLNKPQTQHVLITLENAGHQSFAVGGCVRNSVMGLATTDIDVATSAVPNQVAEVFERAGSKVVPTGIDHGTVTVVREGESFEVTTFRKDVETDGRRAVIAFATDMAEDARRRDFTMNAIYCDARGKLFDPVGGYADALARKVRFVGHPDERIREDYLRSLRFFRFLAQLGSSSEGVDPDALSAIAKNLDGLGDLSAERVGAEMLKLLSSDDPAPALAAMASTGVLARILPGSDIRSVAPLVHLERDIGLPPEPVRRLAALGGGGVESRLRLSRQQARRLDALRCQVQTLSGPAELGWRLGREMALSVLALRHAISAQPIDSGSVAEVGLGQNAVLPISAKDLMPNLTGSPLGDALERATKAWISSGFKLERDALIEIALDRG